jgi:uncharacterized protein YbcC (UPF0753/DUF2309 family)
VQGNGGDIKGDFLQSVMESDLEMYHQPLLSVAIQAPVAKVSEILSRNEHLKTYLIMSGFT